MGMSIYSSNPDLAEALNSAFKQHGYNIEVKGRSEHNKKKEEIIESLTNIIDGAVKTYEGLSYHFPYHIKTDRQNSNEMFRNRLTAEDIEWTEDVVNYIEFLMEQNDFSEEELKECFLEAEKNVGVDEHLKEGHQFHKTLDKFIDPVVEMINRYQQLSGKDCSKIKNFMEKNMEETIKNINRNLKSQKIDGPGM